MKMRVVYILNTSSAYGANRSLVSFINYLAGNGVKCFAILPEAGGIEEELKALGVECFIATYRACVRYPGYIGMPYLVNLVNIPKLAHQIKKWNVDIIHTNSSTHDIGIVIAKLLGKKHVWHVREVLEEHFHTTYYFPALYRKMRGKSDAVICVSNFVYNYNLEKFPNPNMKMLYNPFDLDYYDIARIGFEQKDGVNILIAGNITESKGQIDGVRALAELKHRGINNVRMILAGGAEKKCLEEIEALIAEEQLEGKVDYLGYVSDLRAVRAECDISLNCSFAEALPRVTVEGMLSELLSIGADSGGTAELIRDGITGLLYEPGNYRQLADQIEFAMNNKSKCRKMIIEAKKYAVSHFKLEENAKRLLDLYEEILCKTIWINKRKEFGGRRKMLFNSYIFIFLFLPVTLLLWYLCNRLKRYKLAQFIIVVLSLVFYSYYNWKDAIVILFSISGNWCFSKWMEREKGNVRIGFIGILFNISILCFFKYWNFLIENVNLVFASQFSLKKIIFPLGISFYTIQQISFIADRMRGAAPHYSLLDYASYVIFFPQLIAGPIVSHEDLVPQFQDNEKRKLKLENLVMGISIFSIGLGKKVLLADSLGRVVDAGFSEIGLLDSISAIVVMLSFTFQLFFDFSGYCDMAAGIGYMMNIKLPQNFDSPYKAASVGEFWKRWHMTLNAFFTQYIYIPLGGGRCVKWKWIRNVMIVFLISGIWHGANWTFIIWGILHGIAVVAERASLFSKWSLKVRWFMTFIFLVLSWVLFRSDSMNMAFQFYKKLFSFSNTGYLADLSGNLIDFKFYFLRSCINRFGGNVAVSSFQILLLILLLILSVVCCTKRSCLIELPQKCLTKKDMLLFAVIFSLSVVSLSGVTIFLYFNF